MADKAPTAPGFLGTVLSFSLHPGSSFSRPRASWSRWNPLLYAIVADLIGQLCAALASLVLQGSEGASEALMLTAFSPVSTLVSLAVFGGLIHPVLRALGAKNATILETVNVLALASGPSLLAGIPWIGPVIAVVWGFVISVTGLSVVYKISKLRAVGAMFSLPVAVIVLALGLRVFVVEAFKIPARGLSPSIEMGDHIFVNKLNRVPDYGDLVVFRFPENRSQDFIKRVIGRGGDVVSVVGQRPVINGWTVPWCEVGAYGYSEGSTPQSAGSERHDGTLYIEFLGSNAHFVFVDDSMMGDERQGPYTVPPGEYFVMGDNRCNSYDSRGWNLGVGGTVPADDVRGRATWVWMSFDIAGGIRWDRVGADAQGVTPLAGKYREQLASKIQACLADRPSEAASRPPKN